MDQPALRQALQQRYGIAVPLDLLERPLPGGLDRVITQPITLKVRLTGDGSVHERLPAWRLLRKQTALMTYLEEAGIEPRSLRWELERSADGSGWNLVGRGWMQQLLATPAEASPTIPTYTLVQLQ